MDTDSPGFEDPVECAVAIVWPEGRGDPVCEMYRVDHQKRTWTSKHFSGGATFDDHGRLRDGETARLLAENGTGSGIHRYAHQTPVTFIVADIDSAAFESTRPTEWTVETLVRLPGASVSKFGGR